MTCTVAAQCMDTDDEEKCLKPTLKSTFGFPPKDDVQLSPCIQQASAEVKRYQLVYVSLDYFKSVWMQ